MMTSNRRFSTALWLLSLILLVSVPIAAQAQVSYVVTFDSQGGSEASPTNKVVTYDALYGPLAFTTNTGYTFAGWWTQANGLGTNVFAGTVVKITTNQTLYAKWTANDYTVTFDGQGGSVPTPPNKSVAFGSPYGALATTVLPGYTFAGWWTSPGGAGTMISTGTVVAITADQTLFANWTSKTYVVTFDSQGGQESSPTNKIVTYDELYGPLAFTTNTGYTFAGWWTDVGGSGVVVSAGTVVKILADTTLYAKWTANSYTVTFDAQGGSVSTPPNKSVAFGSSYGTLGTTTRPGYTFTGWWTSPGGAGAMVSASTVVAITADQTLYASWTSASYSVTFDAQGGSAPSPATKAVTIGLPYGTLATTTRSGYTFAGWWTEAGGAGSTVSNATVVTEPSAHTLYAMWTPNSYAVTFDAQGGSVPSPASTNVTYDASYGPLATTARSGYSFGGWWTQVGGAGTMVTASTSVKITANQTLYAKWTATSYTVTFDGQGGSAPSPISKSVTFDSTYGPLATTTRSGYTFAGWWTQPGGTGTLVSASTVVAVTADQTLYASWTLSTYVVTFDAQGGDAPSPASTTVTYDALYGPLATTARAGYTFAGWWTGVGGSGSLVSAGMVVKITADQTLYAKWTASTYTVTFNGQGGSVPTPPNKSVTFDSAYGALATTVLPGYTFAGWWTQPGGTGTMVTAVTMVTSTNDHTLYANWISKAYVLTFDEQSGEAPDFASKSITNDLPYGKLASTTRTGYTFSGWWTEVGGAGTKVSASTVVKITGDQTLYASWTLGNYTVTFDAQGGSSPNPASKSVTFTAPYGTLATTTRSGYTFAGWWTATNGAGTVVTSGTMVTETNHHTLYANWAANDYTVTFDSQGGSSPSPSSRSVTFGLPYGVLSTTSKSGFNFLGWWTGVGGTGTEITSGTVCKIAADQTLYASWAAGGQVRFVILDYMATEGFPQKLFVERINGSNGVATVNYKTKPKTALDWLDFIPKTGTLTWTNGEAGIKVIKIPIVADSLAEGYELFRVLLKKPVGVSLTTETEANVIIPENKIKAGAIVKDATAVRMTKLTKALDDEALTWFSSEQAPWARQTLVTADGVDAGMSGERFGGQLSWLQTDVEGAGKLEFDWLTAGTGMDTCLVLVDGLVRCKLTAGYEWAHETLDLGAGDHNVRWVFVGESGLTKGSVFLDQVKWTPESE